MKRRGGEAETGGTNAPKDLGRTTDDRGRVVSMLDPVALHMMRRHGAIEAEPLRELAEAIGPGVPRGQKAFFWTTFVLGVSALAIGMSRAFLFGFGIDAVGRTLWLITGICLVIGVVSLWQRARRARLARVRRIMLDHRRCPHCGYDLERLPREAEDGATICPECGSAWILSSAQ